MAQGFVRDTVRIPLYRSWIYHASAGGGGSGSTDTGIFLLLAGRTGTTNDPLISTDARGSIYGSGAHAFGLALNAHNVDAVLLLGDSVFLDPAATTIGDGVEAVSAVPLLAFDQDLTIDTSGGTVALALIGYGAQDIFGTRARWTVTGAGSFAHALSVMAPEIYRDTNGELFSAHVCFQDATRYFADGATVTAAPPGGVVSSFISRPGFETASGGDLTFTEPIVGFQHEIDEDTGAGSGAASVHFPHYGFWFVPRGGTGVFDISDDAAFVIEGGTPPTVSGAMYSLWNKAAGYNMVHRASALFGADTTFSSPEAGIEIVGVDPGGGATHTFLNARFADADEAVISTPVDGMQYYNSDVEMFKFQQTGDWIFMVGTVDVVLLTAQTADIMATSFVNSTHGGGYRVSFYAICTTADGAAGTLAFDVGWDDGTGAQTATVASLPLTATGHAQGSYFLATDGSTDVTYAVTNSGAYGTADYAFLAILERVA